MLVDHDISSIESLLRTPAYEKSKSLYLTYRDTSLKSSGEWLLQEPVVRGWLDRQIRFLSVNGGPGAGKSYLSALLAETVRSRNERVSSNQHNRVLTAYFYIKEGDQDLGDLLQILKTIAYQIALLDAVFRSHIAILQRSSDAIGTAKRFWDNVFVPFFSQHHVENSSMMIVLDGLDEAPRETLTSLFALVNNLAGCDNDSANIFVALFARPELSEYFGPRFSASLATLQIGAKNTPDIAAYIKENMTRVLVVTQTVRLKSKKAGVKLAREIRDQVMAKTDDIFIKAVLIMNQLYDKERPDDVFKAIEHSPPRLDALICNVFERILAYEDVAAEDFKEILIWVLGARRPPTMAELYGIIRQHSGSVNDTIEARIRGRYASVFRVGVKPVTYGGMPRIGGAVNRSWAKPEVAAEADLVGFDMDEGSSSDDSDDDDAGEDSSKLLATLTLSPHKTRPSHHESRHELSEATVDRFQYTAVNFTHTTIREFLGGAKYISCRVSNALNIPIHDSAVQAHIAIRCMQRMVRGREDDRLTEACDYLDYAYGCLGYHLRSIQDIASISAADRRELTRLFCALLSDEPGFTAWTQSENVWKRRMYATFFSEAVASLITSKLFTEAMEDEVSPDAWLWIQSCIQRPWDLMRPLSVRCARLLLEEAESELDEEGAMLCHSIIINYLRSVSFPKSKHELAVVSGLTNTTPVLNSVTSL
jgi:hypothetical protein